MYADVMHMATRAYRIAERGFNEPIPIKRYIFYAT